jgi:hypothetical protein
VLEDLTPIYEAERDSFPHVGQRAVAGPRVRPPLGAGIARTLPQSPVCSSQAGLDPDIHRRRGTNCSNAARKIDESGKGVYGFGQNIGEKYVALQEVHRPFAWGNGGDVFDEHGNIVVNSPPCSKRSSSI